MNTIKKNREKNHPGKGMIKLSGLRHKRAKKIDPSLAWLIFQRLYLMHCDIKNKEARNFVNFLEITRQYTSQKQIGKINFSWGEDGKSTFATNYEHSL